MIKRSTNVDIVRIFAFFMVLLVHTFLNNGYYATPIQGRTMIIATYFRQFAMICVPLFMLLTGYLNYGKDLKLNKQYLSKLLKVIIPYILVTLLTYATLCKLNVLKTTLLTMLLNISENGYAWYIEMYIGLFLMMPLINAGWNNIGDKKQKQIIIVVMFILCCLANITTPFGYEGINFWANTYPLLFYITGMYYKEYGVKANIIIEAIILIIATILSLMMALYLFKDSMMSGLNHYNNPLCFIMSVLVFDLLMNINTEKIGNKTRKFLSSIADTTLPAYLVSYVTDLFIYKVYAMTYITTVEERIKIAPILIIVSAICSLTLGKIILIISNQVLKIRRKKI